MGNIVEEIVKRNKLNEGLSSEEKKKYERTRYFIESKGVYNILKRTITHLLTRNLKVDFHLYMDSGSYTDGKKIVVGVPKYAWGLENDLVFSVLKALTGHETEHIESSDFELFVRFQRDIANDFENLLNTGKVGEKIKDSSFNESTDSQNQIIKDLQRANIRKQYGAKLAAHLLNSVEDGRIEKRLGNRMRGYVKHIKFMNALIWENQPVNGENQLQEFLFSITSMSVTGLKSKDWDKHYGGTELDDLLNKIRPLIIKGINEPTAQGCAEQTYKIYEIIAPKVAEMLKDDLDAMDEISDQFNFSDTIPNEAKDGSSGFPGNSISTHFVDEDFDENQDSEGNTQNGESNNDKPKNMPNQQGNENNKSSDSSSESSSEENHTDDGDVKKDNKQRNKDEEESDIVEDTQNERSLVEQYLKDAEKNIKEDLEYDMNQIKQEEEKIQCEEEKKKKESGNLSDSELKDVIIGRGVRNFRLERLRIIKQSLPEHIALSGKKLHRQLSEILMNKKGYNSRNRRRGVIDPTNVWRLGIKERDIFVKKGKPDKTSTVVSVLVDNSGSMTDMVDRNKTKLEYAIEACSILEEGLKGLVPFRIQFFDDDPYIGEVRHKLVSDFGDLDEFNRTYSSLIYDGNANADSISIRIATKELLNRPENKKILFVLSDGLPSSYYNETDAIVSVQNAVRDARKEGVIVIAICFGSEDHLRRHREAYRRMYQKGIIMTEPQNIPMQLVKLLEREVR